MHESDSYRSDRKRSFYKSRIFWGGTLAGGVLVGSAFFINEATPVSDLTTLALVPSASESHSAIRLDQSEPSPEIIDTLSQNVIRIRTSVDPSYQHYGFYGANCTGFIVKNPNNNPSIISAKHCFPDTINTKDGRIIRTVTRDGTNIIQAQAIDFEGKAFHVSPKTYFDSGSRPEFDPFDLINLATNNAEAIQNKGIPITETSKLSLGQRLNLLSIDTRGKLFQNSLFYIGQTSEGVIRMLTFTNLDSTCIPGQSGSAIVDNKGVLRGVFTETSTNPFKIDSDYADLHNLSEDLIGVMTRECYAVGTQNIKPLLINN